MSYALLIIATQCGFQSFSLWNHGDALGFRFPANHITAGERNMLELSGVLYRMSDFCKCTALASFKDITVAVYLPPCVRLMTVNLYCFEICAPIRAPHGQQGTVKDYEGHLGTGYKKRGV